MVWLNHTGGVQLFGSPIANDVSVGGRGYQPPLARSTSHHRVRSRVLGVRRNAALRANSASTEARAAGNPEHPCPVRGRQVGQHHRRPMRPERMNLKREVEPPNRTRRY